MVPCRRWPLGCVPSAAGREERIPSLTARPSCRAEAGALGAVMQSVEEQPPVSPSRLRHLQEGFGCVVANRFDQLFDDESDPFEVLKAAREQEKEAGGEAALRPWGQNAAQAPPFSDNSMLAGKQLRKESQKDRRTAAPQRRRG